jgi:Protein of unknown function (DUF3631)
VKTLLSNAELDCLAIESDTRTGERVMARLSNFLRRFVSYPSEHAHVAHALWCVHAHLMEKWESTPRLAFLSAEPASGKTRALEITELLVPNPVTAVNVSPAYLFRKVGSEEGVTLLYDEIDTVFGPKARENEELRGLLNAGHRKGAVAGRCVVRGKNIETEEIPAYAAVAMAGLGWLPDTILSRSVIVRMRRRHAGERVEPYRRRVHAAEGYRIRDTIVAWAHSASIDWPNLPDEIQDRDADVWEPLVAIADAIGGDWPARARAAGIALVAESKEGEPSLGIRLLTDLQSIFEGEQELSSKAILERLQALAESPWGDLHGKPLDERGLAKRLRAYGVKPKTIRTGAGTPRGYSKADLEDQWRRYLPELPDKSKTTKTSETFPEQRVADVADVLEFTAKGGEAALIGHKCDYCGNLGQTLECHYGSTPTWLHRECEDHWRTAYDKRDDGLEIPGFLDRRTKQAPNEEFHD